MIPARAAWTPARAFLILSEITKFKVLWRRQDTALKYRAH